MGVLGPAPTLGEAARQARKHAFREILGASRPEDGFWRSCCGQPDGDVSRGLGAGVKSMIRKCVRDVALRQVCQQVLAT